MKRKPDSKKRNFEISVQVAAGSLDDRHFRPTRGSKSGGKTLAGSRARFYSGSRAFMKHSDFVHLHLHTEYSMLDGAARVGDVVAKAAEYGMPAMAITDHGGMFGAVDFFQASLGSTL